MSSKSLLGYAYESDAEGIIDLVRILEDKESLYSLATLINPEAMTEAIKRRNIRRILNKYEANLFLNSYITLKEELSRVFRTTIFDLKNTKIGEADVAYTFDLAPLIWLRPLPAFISRGGQRNMIRGLRKVLKRTKLNLIEGPNGINVQNVSLTPISIEDWNEIVKLLGKNPIKEYNLGEPMYLDPGLVKRR